jgi:hypothetical protein
LPCRGFGRFAVEAIHELRDGPFRLLTIRATNKWFCLPQ